MVRHVFGLFHRELKGVQEAAFLLAAATILSSLLGLLRDRLLAGRFGAGAELDVYYAAFRIPDLLYAASLFFVASTAIIPLFLERLTESEEQAHKFIEIVFISFFVSIIVLVAAAYILMPLVVPFLVPGFEKSAQQEVVWLSRMLLISPVFLGLSSLVSGVLQSFRRFFVYAASFLFYNIGIIVGILLFVPRWGLEGLAWGVVLGSLLHVAIQIPSLLRVGFFPRVGMRWKWSELFHVFRRSFPRTLGLATTQLTFVAATAIASTLGAGSIAVFQFSFNLQSISLAVIGFSYSVAAFPTMAELIVKKERVVFFEHLVSASRHIVFWTLPISVLFIVLRAQIVRVVLGTGAFGWAETRLVAASLALFALGAVAQSLAALFVRAFYAIGNVRIPVIINVVSMVGTVILAFFFVDMLRNTTGLQELFLRILRVSDVSQSAVLGLPLAFTVGSLVNALLLGFCLGRVDGEFHTRKLGASLGEIFVASVFLGVVSYAVLQGLAPLFDLETFWGIFFQGLLAGLSGIGVAACVLYVRKNKEFDEIRDVVSRKFWQKETVGPEQEHL